MANLKLDVIIEAVRFAPGGQIECVRGYERRGPVFSDRIILSRDELVRRLESGKKIALGERIAYQGATFKTGAELELVKENGSVFINAGGSRVTRDELKSVLLF